MIYSDDMGDFKTLIRKHETEANILIAEVYDTVKRRNKSSKARQDWKRAASRFHEHGRDFFSLLERCWAEGIEQDEDLRAFTFSYLAVDPYFFRSGYFMERLVRRLKKPDLSESEKMIIQNLILRRIDTKALRNFRDICRLLPRVETQTLREQITERLMSDDPSVRHRAELAVTYLSDREAEN